MTPASRIPEEPFDLDEGCVHFKVRGRQYTKYVNVSYGLMQVEHPDGGLRLARIGPSFHQWFLRGGNGPAPDDIDFDVSEREVEAASWWRTAGDGRRKLSPPKPLPTGPDGKVIYPTYGFKVGDRKYTIMHNPDGTLAKYGLMLAETPSGELALARVTRAYWRWVDKGQVGPPPEGGADFSVTDEERDIARRWYDVEKDDPEELIEATRPKW